MVIYHDKKLFKTIVDISYNHKLSHLGSNLSSVKIIDDIFYKKKPDDIFILSAGHCAIALYAVIQKYHNISANDLFLKHGGHPHLDDDNYLHCSAGSLGMGITVAIGRAIANPNRTAHCLISDGECAEGSVWEALRFIYEQKINNIKIYCNINGYCAYDVVDTEYLEKRLLSFLPSINIIKTEVEQFPFLHGLNSHYHIMSKENYEQALSLLLI